MSWIQKRKMYTIVMGCDVDLQQNFTGVTLAMTLSTDRMNRLSFHLDRWHEPISIVIQLYENELPTVGEIVTTLKRTNIRFTFYILQNNTSSNDKCTYVLPKKKIIHTEYCFAYNELRDLAIETIKLLTIYYLMVIIF